MRLRLARPTTLLTLALALAACGGDDEVDSDEEARVAYLGLDQSIGKALGLGMDGFNAADSANIDDQEGTGDEGGTIVVGGQVDQGSSDNKGLRLTITMVDYSDGLLDRDDDDEDDELVEIVYDTDPEAPPELDLSLRDIPDGTLTGTLLGTFLMEDWLEGEVTLDLALSGEIEDDGAGGIQRVAGSTSVTGTATSDDGVYDVEVTL
jgi:hypothetical protein